MRRSGTKRSSRYTDQKSHDPNLSSLICAIKWYISNKIWSIYAQCVFNKKKVYIDKQCNTNDTILLHFYLTYF